MKDFLVQNRDAVLSRWFELVLESYPADGAAFFQRDKDRFANPVGVGLSLELARIYDALVDGADYQVLHAPVDAVIRIRAVQDMSPSSAVGFVFLLKKAIRDEIVKARREDELVHELLAFEPKIDYLALLAFEIYMSCREQIYRIKANEIRARSIKLLERTNLFGTEEDQDEEF